METHTCEQYVLGELEYYKGKCEELEDEPEDMDEDYF